MTEKKRTNLGKWRPDLAREAGRALIPSDLAPADDDRRRRALANAHIGAAAPMADFETPKPATVATLATVKAEGWAGSLQAALENTLRGYADLDAAPGKKPRRRGQLRAFTELQNGIMEHLGNWAAEKSAPRITDVLNSLDQLAAAIDGISTAWDKTDPRAREILCDILGTAGQCPFPAPHVDLGAYLGAHRMNGFRDASRWIADAVAKARASLPQQDFRSGGEHDELIKWLANFYADYTGGDSSPRKFIIAIAGAINASTSCTLTDDAIDKALSRMNRPSE